MTLPPDPKRLLFDTKLSAMYLYHLYEWPTSNLLQSTVVTLPWLPSCIWHYSTALEPKMKDSIFFIQFRRHTCTFHVLHEDNPYRPIDVSWRCSKPKFIFHFFRLNFIYSTRIANSHMATSCSPSCGRGCKNEMVYRQGILGFKATYCPRGVRVTPLPRWPQKGDVCLADQNTCKDKQQ